jgi:hypothetical protein
VLVQVFDRVLDRQDVSDLPWLIPIDHRGQRRGLAAAGRTSHEHQTARPISQFREDWRQTEFLERPDLFRNQAVDRTHGALLIEDVAAEASDAAKPECHVELPRLLELLLLRVGQHAVRQRLQNVRRQLRQFQPAQVPVHAHLWRRPNREVQVRALQLERGLQQIRQVHRRHKSSVHGSRLTAYGYGLRLTAHGLLHGFAHDFVDGRQTFAHFAQAALAKRQHALAHRHAAQFGDRQSGDHDFACASVISITSNTPTRPL